MKKIRRACSVAPKVPDIDGDDDDSVKDKDYLVRDIAKTTARTRLITSLILTDHQWQNERGLTNLKTMLAVVVIVLHAPVQVNNYKRKFGLF